jgi:hypothetical protein
MRPPVVLCVSTTFLQDAKEQFILDYKMTEIK